MPSNKINKKKKMFFFPSFKPIVEWKKISKNLHSGRTFPNMWSRAEKNLLRLTIMMNQWQLNQYQTGFFSLLVVCVKVDVSPQVTQTFLSLSVLLQHHHSLLGLPPRDGDGLVRSSPPSLKSHTEQKLNTLEPQPLLPSSPLLLKSSLLLLLTGAPCYPERLSLAALLLRMTFSIDELFLFFIFYFFIPTLIH